jgi:lipoate-protein ligase A
MSVDIALFQAAIKCENGLRFYSWDGPWVTLGRFQNPELDLLDATRVPWVMRPTGGKAVLHGHDLTITLATPVTSPSVKQVYRTLIMPLVRAMNDVGQPAALGEETPFCRGGNASDCFRNISPNDVVEPRSGRKLIGCALKISRSAALAQCSIPLGLPLVDPATVYRNPHTALPLDISKEELIDAISGQVLSSVA